mmetsp:Transcript_32123/g.46694  ORF Transcript_32123/g.46694 Transcript_32123/m.46694 type:complete len:96 (+) Transcript_32123:152-439(+)
MYTGCDDATSYGIKKLEIRNAQFVLYFQRLTKYNTAFGVVVAKFTYSIKNRTFLRDTTKDNHIAHKFHLKQQQHQIHRSKSPNASNQCKQINASK